MLRKRGGRQIGRFTTSGRCQQEARLGIGWRGQPQWPPMEGVHVTTSLQARLRPTGSIEPVDDSFRALGVRERSGQKDVRALSRRGSGQDGVRC